MRLNLLDSFFVELGQHFSQLLLLGLLISIVSALWLKFASSFKTSSWGAFPRRSRSLFGVLEFFRSLLWVFLVIFVLRSFLFEPYRIPSASMEPTLKAGDMILVSKLDYGLPNVLNHGYLKLRSSGFSRGDVVVFGFPCDSRVKFIKRIIGLPGDVVHFGARGLTINGQAVPQTLSGVSGDYPELYEEALPSDGGARTHSAQFLMDPNLLPAGPFKPSCSPDWLESFQYLPQDEIHVPDGMLFVMGDNRLNSQDGRFWGFVPQKGVEGHARWVLFNLRDLLSLNFEHSGSIR